ncbi:MAG: septum formation initiator family protein [Ignavibacteriota bacterium]
MRCDTDAGGQAPVHQQPRQTFGFGRTAAGIQDYNLVCHYFASDATIIFQAFSAMKRVFSRWAFGVAFMGVVIYSAVTLTGPHGVHAWMEKERLIQEMQKKNAGEAQKIERIQEHIKRLDGNSEEQEREIRERLKMVHPDEKVFITGDPAKQ